MDIVNSVQPLPDFIDGISGADFAYKSEDTKTKHADVFPTIPMLLSDF